MPTPLNPTTLAPLLRDHQALVEAVMADIYADRAWKMTLDILQMIASDNQITLAEMLSQTLERDGLTGAFISVLRNRAPQLLPVDGFAVSDSVDANAIADPHFNPDKLTEFSSVADARRCRIAIRFDKNQHPVEKGSGILVGRRLVLTAAHVIADALQDLGRLDLKRNGLSRASILVTDINGKDYAAWPAFLSPPHARELAGQKAPRSAYATHTDVALLRLFKPIGRAHKFGHFDLDGTTAPQTGTRQLWLLHFPAGDDKGYTQAAYRRSAADDMYLPHSAPTEGGSSGGAGFSGEFRYLGHHQAGRTAGNGGRIVPYERYAGNAAFLEQINGDSPPDYLWSTDESPEGHFIIGRNTFFDGLAAMIENKAPNLRGIWVKRIDATLPPTGLSFGYDMLTAYLNAYDRPDRIHRVSTDLISDDLLHEVNARLLSPDRSLLASAGVRPDETSLAAEARDRAVTLANRLDAAAAQSGAPHWIYFDNPPSGLSREAQVQMEHLVSEILSRRHLRLILSGFETFTLRNRLYSTIREARDQGQPGLLVEHIGEFTREDVFQTVAAMADSLGLGWKKDVIDAAVRQALAGLSSTAGVYSSAVAGMVAKALRAQIRTQGVGSP
ncbi:trypsin-like peptidase domain-containing protein [uncultured Roseovarius sp.]|uniref:trypsin-like serine peptidase n=1 Tax=uncultured Roseovarius sp. TaxID=293344 RepID=UPI00262CF554|nr:trypsin-like peptidase domain-containing protein [uncultured Roseovarius sp.]